jgi:hypothetical protein
MSDVMVWDTERPYHYARWTPERRLLLGGEDRQVTAPCPGDGGSPAAASPVNGVVTSPRRQYAICGRTLKPGCLLWPGCELNVPGRVSSR